MKSLELCSDMRPCMLRLALCTVVNGGVYLLSLHDIFGLKLVCFGGGLPDCFCSVWTSRSERTFIRSQQSGSHLSCEDKTTCTLIVAAVHLLPLIPSVLEGNSAVLKQDRENRGPVISLESRLTRLVYQDHFKWSLIENTGIHSRTSFCLTVVSRSLVFCGTMMSWTEG